MSTPATEVHIDTQTRIKPLRFVTAASLFDGHDAAINIMRRLIQAEGAEVIHLGHNRSVADVVRAALQEDADGIALSSYQGGHNEYFRYMVDMLVQAQAAHIRVFGGGGGTITPAEIEALQAIGVERIYHPNDGLRLGLKDMIGDLIARTLAARARRVDVAVPERSDQAIARLLTAIENDGYDEARLERLRKAWQLAGGKVPVLGITGTGGAGKSSVVDELVSRFLQYFPELRVAVLAIDPTRRRSGGALLGDRIRMNSLRSSRVYMRSMATRRQHQATNAVLRDAIACLKAQGFDLVIVETAGIGQSDSAIVDLVDLPIYVMTADYGAATQLEKIDMLDYAEVVVLNKFDRRGSDDALRDVRKQWRRNRAAFRLSDEETPVYPTIASQFNDPGTNWLFANLCRIMVERLALPAESWTPIIDLSLRAPRATTLIPSARVRYLAEIAEAGRRANQRALEQAERAAEIEHLAGTMALFGVAVERGAAVTAAADDSPVIAQLKSRYQQALAALDPEVLAALRDWPQRLAAITAPTYSYEVRGKAISGQNYRVSLSHQQIPKIAAPTMRSLREQTLYLLNENLPGHYPYTAGVYPYRRESEDPIRMFAGEGTPERTNRRFHLLAAGQNANRLSTAFDSVTLYGEDPAIRPDIYGKIGNSGVSIATLDDMKKLYSGFDLCDPATSVSMTINGPAPIILALFMNTAIDQQVEKYLRQNGQWSQAEQRLRALYADRNPPSYNGDLPAGNDALGLGLLGVSGVDVVDPETYARIAADTLSRVRGTVQADILKEDQAQNTCIFSTEFALKMMGDVQASFIEHGVRNFYSVSISGYHIAEAGANPISQLAFTLSNGFTIVEYYLARGMKIDDFAPNLSFFFSNGMDPEYTVIGRVARRIWARAMKERYGAGPRSQMLKYHVQTSGRSLHAQEIQFNDIRTTLQALYALFDNCNSLHTNAFDEAITTPTEESVRRAQAIQLIINRELGLNFCENPWQGSYIVEYLTNLVEEAVYREFEAISERGGVLGAMDTMYQRGKIQDESMHYEQKKHDGSLPLIGVNTFLPREHAGETATEIELARSTETEKQQQIDNVAAYQSARNGLAGDAYEPSTLDDLKQVARQRGNLYDQLLRCTRYYSLGQISHALYEVGGEYRRNM